jgi:hypothetical protein
MSSSTNRRDARRRASAVLGAVVPALAACALAVAAPAGPSAAPTLRARPAHVAPGATFVLHGHGFRRDAHVVLRAGRRRDARLPRIGGADTGRRGSFSAPIDIDAHAAPGVYLAIACQRRCRVMATVRFRVLRP